jgi:ribosomal protein S19
MARSLKKGPFVELHLLEKIDKMNASGAKKAIKPGRVARW